MDFLFYVVKPARAMRSPRPTPSAAQRRRLRARGRRTAGTRRCRSADVPRRGGGRSRPRRSPAIHNVALAASGLSGWRCGLRAVDRALRRGRARASAAGFRGINVTIPHKEAALAHADEATATAAAVGPRTRSRSRRTARSRRQHRRPRLLEALPVIPPVCPRWCSARRCRARRRVRAPAPGRPT